MKYLLLMLLCSVSFAADTYKINPRTGKWDIIFNDTYAPSKASVQVSTTSLQNNKLSITSGTIIATDIANLAKSTNTLEKINDATTFPTGEFYQMFDSSPSWGGPPAAGAATDVECRLSTETLSRINDTSVDSGSIWQMFADSAAWAGHAEGGSTSYTPVFLGAGKFLSAGYQTKSQWGWEERERSINSVPTTWTILTANFHDNPMPNSRCAQFVVPPDWTDTDTYAYINWVTSGPIANSVCSFVEISSSPYTDGSFNIQFTTMPAVTGTFTSYVQNTTTFTFVSGGGILSANKSVWLWIGRISQDTCTDVIKVVNVVLSKTKLW